jgi:hypothetical protein
MGSGLIGRLGFYNYSYKSLRSAFAISIKRFAIFLTTASKYFLPFSLEALTGLPIPVSSVAFDHFRSVHAQPS